MSLHLEEAAVANLDAQKNRVVFQYIGKPKRSLPPDMFGTILAVKMAGNTRADLITRFVLVTTGYNFSRRPS